MNIDKQEIPRCKCGSYRMRNISLYPILDQRDRLFHCYDCGERYTISQNLKQYSVAMIIDSLQKENTKLKQQCIEFAESMGVNWLHTQVNFEKPPIRICQCCYEPWDNHKNDCIVLKAEKFLKENK